MKFEYNLNYDFVNKKLSFRVTKFEESLRCKNDITIIDGWKIKSIMYPELSIDERKIFLCGSATSSDYNVCSVCCYDLTQAYEIANVLEQFQAWVEETRPEPVEMTIAEIEEKLGIHNLKIIKE